MYKMYVRCTCLTKSEEKHLFTSPQSSWILKAAGVERVLDSKVTRTQTDLLRGCARRAVNRQEFENKSS